MEKIWMKHWPADIPKEITFPQGEVPVFEYLRLAAAKHPEKAAIIYYGREISYRELDEASDRFANYLLDLGLTKGGRVGLFLPNCPQYIIAHFGTHKMGGIVCPCSPLFKELELAYEINDAEMSALVTLDLMLPIVNAVKKQTTSLKGDRAVIVTNFNDYLPAEPTMALTDAMKIPKTPVAPESGIDFVDALAGASPEPPAVAIDIHEDIALFEYTGGTTGLPKGAMLSHRANLYKPTAVATICGLTPESRVLSVMPFFNIAGMLFIMAPVIAGATVIVVTQFDPLAVLQAIDRHKATFWYSAVPMNLQVMGHPQAKDYDLSSLKFNLTTSFVVSLNEAIARQWEQFTGGCPLLEGAYGLSETHTADTFCPRDKIKYGSMGIPGHDQEFKIVDFVTGEEVPIGEEGEIALRNPGCMKGYWKKPQATANTLVDGFVHTGDVGKFDEDGYLWWLGRIKEMIKVSGFSVFPEEVELLLNNHPAVLENAVIGVKNDKKGEVVKSFVVLNPDYEGKVTEEELIAWSRSNMTPHKVPAHIEFRTELPKTGVKLLRRVLRDVEAQKAGAGA